MHEMKQVSFQKYAKHDRQTSSLAGGKGGELPIAYTRPVYLRHLKKDKSGLESE